MSNNIEIAALLRERESMVTHGKASRVKDIDLALAEAGYVAPKSEPPKTVKRTTTRKA